jgi:hypothetical protein
MIRRLCRRSKTNQRKNRRLSKSGARLVDPNDDHIGLAVNVRSNRKLLPPTLPPRRLPRRPRVPHQLLPTPLSRREVRAARATIVASARIERNGRNGMNASSGWNAKVNAQTGKVTQLGANDRGANVVSESSGPSANSTTQSLSAAAQVGATNNRIRIPRSPNLLRSNSSLNRPTKSRLEHERQGIGTSAHRQMVVACADGTDADRCSRAYNSRVCPP